MNEKQKKLKALDDTIERFPSFESGYGELPVVCAGYHDDVVKLALNLLADEPEKSLRDYTLAELAELVHDAVNLAAACMRQERIVAKRLEGEL